MISVVIPITRPTKAERCIDLLKLYGVGIDFELVHKVNPDPEHISAGVMCNSLLSQTHGEQIMILADDVIPHDNIFTHPLEALLAMPNASGLVGLHDQMYHGTRATHWIMSRDFLDSFHGQLICTEYAHCFSDDEMIDIAKERGCYVITEQEVLIHDHPLVTGEAMDAVYARAYGPAYQRDHLIYLRRKQERWMKRTQ